MYNSIKKVILALAMSLPAFSAGAAVAMADADAIPSDTATLQGISVVALKQADRLRSEAVSVSILTRADLERLNAVAIKSISEAVPNFYIPDYGSRITSSIYVRGIGARMDQPAVGLTVDNLPVMNKDAYDFDIPDIVDVEMLRGPQSTLYGRNTMAGVINVTTLSPMRWQGVRLRVSAANGNSYRFGAGAYFRFNDKTALSANISGLTSGGFFRNTYNDALIDKEKSISGRMKFEWRPSARFHLMNVAALSFLRQGGYPYESVASGRIEYNDTCFYKRNLFSDALTLKKIHDKFVATSITSVQYIDDNMTLDQDFLPESFFTLTQKKKEIAFTEDLMFRNPNSSSAYNWLAGIFGFYKHLNMNAPVTFKDMGISQLIESHRNDANPYYPIKWDSRSFPLNSDFKINTYGIALYHESRLRLGRWLLSAGLRFDYEHAEMNYRSHCFTGYTIYNASDEAYNMLPPEKWTVYGHSDIDIDDRGSISRHFLTVMPKVSAVWNFSEDSDDNNLYASIAKGYKAGGFNTQMFSDVLQQRLMNMMGIGSKYNVDDVVGYKPEESWNYEVGTHFSIPSAALSGEVDLFFIDCRNQQMTMFPDGTTTGRIMTNAGKTHSFGGELSLHWNIADAFSLSGCGVPMVNVSYGYTNARFRQFFDGIRDYKGKHLPYVPSNTLFAQLVYQIPLSNRNFKSLEFDVDVRGVGDIYWNESNTLSQKFYSLLGVRASVSGGSWDVSVYAENICSTKFYTFYFMSMGNEFLQRGKPFQCGVSVSYNFQFE